MMYIVSFKIYEDWTPIAVCDTEERANQAIEFLQSTDTIKTEYKIIKVVHY